MNSISSVIHYAGIFVLCVGLFFLLVLAFEKSKGWGFGMLLFGGVLWPVFVIKYWEDTSFWFFVALTGGLAVYLV
jgi:hypothetical protein